MNPKSSYPAFPFRPLLFAALTFLLPGCLFIDLFTVAVLVTDGTALIADQAYRHANTLDRDNNAVFFIAESELAQSKALYMYRGSMKDRITVSVPAVAGGGVQGFFLAPDGQHIAYLADQQNNGVYELYLVKLFWRQQLIPQQMKEVPINSPYATGSSATVEVPVKPRKLQAVTLGETIKLADGVSTKKGVHWSPGGDALAYFSERGHHVKIVNLASGVTRSHSAGHPLESGQRVLPGLRSSLVPCSGNNAWSADGTSFAYLIPSAADRHNGQLTILTRVGDRGLRVHSIEGDACTWSPIGSRLAVLSSELIKLVELGKGTVTTSTSVRPAQGAGRIVWAPDGREFLLRVKNTNRKFTLHRVRLRDASLETHLLSRDLVSEASWSPGGSQIAFLAEDRRFGRCLYIVSTQSPGKRRRISGSDWPCDISTGGTDDFSAAPAWSPDGAWIAYIDRRDNRVYGVRGDGSEPVKLVWGLSSSLFGRTSTQLDPLTSSFSIWSPDSRRLFYVARLFTPPISGFHDLYVASPEDKSGARIGVISDRQFDLDSAIPAFAHWSPDSQRLLHLTKKGEKYELHISSVDGLEHVRLAKDVLPSAFAWLSGISVKTPFARERVSSGP